MQTKTKTQPDPPRMEAPRLEMPRSAVEHVLGWHVPDWSAFELRLVVDGQPITKKTGQRIIRVGGYPRIAPSKRYQEWEASAIAQLRAQWWQVFSAPIPDGVPINLCVLWWLKSHAHWPDLSGTYEGPQDALQGGHKGKGTGLVIVDDTWIYGHDGSKRLLDHRRPRVELILTRHEI